MGQLSRYLDDQDDSGDATFTVDKAEPAEKRPTTTHSLAGQLYLSNSGWILLSVPNALANGLFKAMDEPGVELPPGSDDGPFNAHISVMRPEELEGLGGGEKITERGKTFRYGLGPIREVEPAGWDGMAKCWFVTVISPDLQELRLSYGLSPRPNQNKFDFHISFAVRRRGVLGRNSTSKQGSFAGDGLAAQMYSPTWTKNKSLPSNLIDNAVQAHQRGQELANQRQASQIFAASFDPQLQIERTRAALSGDSVDTLQEPIDQLLFTDGLR